AHGGVEEGARALIAAVLAAAAVAAEPVGPRLLVGRGGAVYASGTRLLDSADDAAWSRDGTRLVFVRGGDLWLANGDGSGRRALTATPAVQESEPSWGTGDRTIVYTATIDGSRQIRLLQLAGGATRRL